MRVNPNRNPNPNPNPNPYPNLTEGDCSPARLPHLDREVGEVGDLDREIGHLDREVGDLDREVGAAQYACTALLGAGERRGAPGGASGGASGGGPGCRLPAGVGMWDAFLYMLPDERASEHVCRHLECLPPLPSTSHGQYDLYGRCRR